MRSAAVVAVFALVLMYGAAVFAHEESEESSSEMKMEEMMKNMDMKMQHETMRMIAEHWAEAREALKEKEWKEAEEAVEEITEAAEGMKGFKPHRNADRFEYFMNKHGLFIKRLKDLGRAIESKDAAAAGRLAEAVQRSCNQCHAMFR
ncbi:MAG: hypothetical protein GXO94_03755 [Nitrospirae bacterium]|nr:hypothetical protein [Nitrospirota bacterium]